MIGDNPTHVGPDDGGLRSGKNWIGSLIDISGFSVPICITNCGSIRAIIDSHVSLPTLVPNP
jgi:hypothetical protein